MKIRKVEEGKLGYTNTQCWTRRVGNYHCYHSLLAYCAVHFNQCKKNTTKQFNVWIFLLLWQWFLQKHFFIKTWKM